MLTENMTLADIVAQGYEIKAIRILLNSLEQENENLWHENNHYGACLRAIRKINNNKNEAIDALCEKEE